MPSTTTTTLARAGPLNIMADPRVVRGSTFTSSIVPPVRGLLRQLRQLQACE